MLIDTSTLRDFVRESNRIEGINREPTEAELSASSHFLSRSSISVQDLVELVSVYQKDAELRNKLGLEVFIGNHKPPAGGPQIATFLRDLLRLANAKLLSAYHTHHRYLGLRPFTDGNDRSGRMLWLWMMEAAPLGFLHHWYYQSLEGTDWH